MERATTRTAELARALLKASAALTEAALFTLVSQDCKASLIEAAYAMTAAAAAVRKLAQNKEQSDAM